MPPNPNDKIASNDSVKTTENLDILHKKTDGDVQQQKPWLLSIIPVRVILQDYSSYFKHVVDGELWSNLNMLY